MQQPNSRDDFVQNYISEQDAIESLERLTGKKITLKDIEQCAVRGVIPAYMQFTPKNKELYSGSSFHLVWGNELNYENPETLTTPAPGCQEDFWAILPFPLPSSGLVKSTTGVPYRVFVLRNDGHLESVTDQHYVKVYSDQELRQTAKNVKRYLSKGEVHPTNHACCPTWVMDRDQDHDLTTVWIASPFADTENAVDVKMKNSTLSPDEKLDPRERTSLHLMIAALASKAGYPLDNPSKAEAMLKRDLDAIGLCKSLNGKQTAEKYFRAAAYTAEQERMKSEDSLNRK